MPPTKNRGHKHNIMNPVNDYIKKNWKNTVRTGKEGIGKKLPYPVTVPCMKEGFTCFFYWDTYFTNLGLMIDNEEQATWNVENMRSFVEDMGFIPNGNLPVMFNRSQPPLYPHAVMDLYEKTKDVELLKRHYSAIKTEYSFWMKNRSTAIGLNQYNSNPTDKEIEDFYVELKGRGAFPSLKKERAEILGYFAEAESGWDFCYRYDESALNYVQIDLNSILYGTEKAISKIAGLIGESEDARLFEGLSQKRKGLINALMRADDGTYHDYDFVNKKMSPYYSCASFTPFVFNLSDDAEACKKTLEKLEQPHGISAGERIEKTGLQWAYPNMWPPLVYFAYMALRAVGLNEDADRIRKKYLAVVDSVFEKTNDLWEKFNCSNGTVSNSEYSSPSMMGWTAGVYRYLFEEK